MPSPPSLGERVHYYSTTVKSRIIAIANVDHFLHFAEALGRDFPHLDRDQSSELRLPRTSGRVRRAGAPEFCAKCETRAVRRQLRPSRKRHR